MKGIKKEIRDRWYLRWVLVFSNWLFQGIHHLDKTEKIYRILFTSLTAIFYYKLQRKNMLFSIIVAHTLNWFVNNNIRMILVHRLMISKLSKEDLFEYSEKLKLRLERENWILYAASFGSICRGKLKSSSDLDVSIVRKPGIKNGLKGLWFILKEKKIADFYKIPLELYLNDIPETSIKRFASEKNPVILFDKYNVVDRYYDEKLDLAEARKLNGLQ